MIYIIRHGETRKNKEKLLQGRSNDPLNEAGIRTIVIACGRENVHSTEEFCKLSELNRSAKLTLRLMTMKSE